MEGSVRRTAAAKKKAALHRPTFRHRALKAEARVRELEEMIAWERLARIDETGKTPF